jgi:DNA (cytosine-5)-methyltransferase 1
VLGSRGGRQLNPRFVEWMQGLPDGWVTDVAGVSRSAALRVLGGLVPPQQCAAALRELLARMPASREGAA